MAALRIGTVNNASVVGEGSGESIGKSAAVAGAAGYVPGQEQSAAVNFYTARVLASKAQETGHGLS